MDHLSKNLFLAWAVPVDPVAVTASLFAFESTYAAINVFRLCARHNPSLCRLPPELLMSIEDSVLNSSRADEIATRDMPFRCLKGCCTPEDHLTDDKINELKQLAMEAFEFQKPNESDGDDDQSAFEEAFEHFFTEFLYENDGDWCVEHQDHIDKMYLELIGRPFTTKLSKAQAVSHVSIDTELSNFYCSFSHRKSA